MTDMEVSETPIEKLAQYLSPATLVTLGEALQALGLKIVEAGQSPTDAS